jgi:hypothetical protein
VRRLPGQRALPGLRARAERTGAVSVRQRRVYWRCPVCRALVPRDRDLCACGSSKRLWRVLRHTRNPDGGARWGLWVLTGLAGLLLLLGSHLL